ncbi:MAG: SBBP repeat-containing protein, partial [Planctomycetota bacterium]
MFYAKTSRYTLWLIKEGLVFDSTRRSENPKSEIRNPKQTRDSNPQDSKQKQDRLSTHKLTNLPTHQLANSPTRFSRDVSRLLFVGANKNPEIVPFEEAKLRVNYFKGNDKSKWHHNVPTSRAVLYRNLYKNIDLKVYGIEKQIEYDWIVKPGGNPGDIMFIYKNVKGTRIDEKGNLMIETEFGELMHQKPVSYQQEKENYILQNTNYKQITSPKSQITNKTLRSTALSQPEVVKPETGCRGLIHQTRKSQNNRNPVAVEFKKIAENTYGFSVEKYDKSKDLIIDPVVLVYSTYLGGADNEYLLEVAADSNGYVYITGYTMSTDFPVMDAYQTYLKDESDAFISKIETTGSGADSLVYSTYLGGNEDDAGWGIAVDNSGTVYVTGGTRSTNFPTRNGLNKTIHGYDTDAFVTRLDTTRSGADGLVYSTYLGGKNEDFGKGIAVDSSGYVYTTGSTGSEDFPTLNGYPGKKGMVFLTRIDTSRAGTAAILYSTHLGGSRLDQGESIVVDESGNAYLTGYTLSYNFPVRDGLQVNSQGEADAFVAKIDTTKSGTASLVYSTYLGGSKKDFGWDIALDSSGYVHITGYTMSTDFPILNGYQQTNHRFDIDVFVTKLDITQKGAAGLIYSTYLGGGGIDAGNAIAVDESGNTYVTGDTLSTNFPILNQYQSDRPERDAFVTKFDTTRSGVDSLIFSTYLGGAGDDRGEGIAVDESGNIYVAGWTSSNNFPTKGAIRETRAGKHDVYVTKLSGDKPAVTILSPGQGDNVYGTVDIKVKAEDDSGIAWVNFYIDEELKHTDNDEPYNYNWESANQANGTKKIKAEAINKENQAGSAAITVNVQNMIITMNAARVEM